MNTQEFLSLNKQVKCSDLAEMLEVSANTITKMKKGVTKMQSLALKALNDELAESNAIYLTTRECTQLGSTYFTAWITYKNKNYFMLYQHGYGSHAEHLAIEQLHELGLLPSNNFSALYREFNTRIERTSIECKKSEMFKGDEYDG